MIIQKVMKSGEVKTFKHDGRGPKNPFLKKGHLYHYDLFGKVVESLYHKLSRKERQAKLFGKV